MRSHSSSPAPFIINREPGPLSRPRRWQALSRLPSRDFYFLFFKTAHCPFSKKRYPFKRIRAATFTAQPKPLPIPVSKTPRITAWPIRSLCFRRRVCRKVERWSWSRRIPFGAKNAGKYRWKIPSKISGRTKRRNPSNVLAL